VNSEPAVYLFCFEILIGGMMRTRLIMLGLGGLLILGWGGPGTTFAKQDASLPPDLKKKIGQMLMVGFHGENTKADTAIARAVSDWNLGGVLLLNYGGADGSKNSNIQSPRQLKTLVDALQNMAVEPLLIAVDQEGGRVSRLKPSNGFSPLLSAAALGEKDDVSLTCRQARLCAAMLASAGINLNLAPVVDMDLNPANPVIGRLDRSYSSDPVKVVRHAGKTVEVHRRYGVLCSLKHFPGHGSAGGDSHKGFVDVSPNWQRQELEPFSRLIEAGQADIIMTAHIFNTLLDKKNPATLSHSTLTGLLRRQLQFRGVIISDDLMMGAIRKNYSYEDSVAKAINAGVDILLVSGGPDNLVPQTVEAIQRMVAEGRIDVSRIEESCARIRALKQRLEEMREEALPLIDGRVVDEDMCLKEPLCYL
jgi:beta-N-acetylhexosaminidase